MLTCRWDPGMRYLRGPLVAPPPPPPHPPPPPPSKGHELDHPWAGAGARLPHVWVRVLRDRGGGEGGHSSSSAGCAEVSAEGGVGGRQGVGVSSSEGGGAGGSAGAGRVVSAVEAVGELTVCRYATHAAPSTCRCVSICTFVPVNLSKMRLVVCSGTLRPRFVLLVLLACDAQVCSRMLAAACADVC